ncbi:MAG: hypothetical protein HY550_02605 [Elusimicrobia bacterium]|nr:hypothetical protein [Elusimicrobiota bacterium]
MKCPKCGYENEEGAAFCNMCYEVLNKAVKPDEPALAAGSALSPEPFKKAVLPGEPQKEADPETLKKIHEGWVAALVCAGFTLLAVIVASMVPSMASLIDAWALVDVALIFVLAFGIRARSRTAATLMFLYYLASKLYMFKVTGKFSGIFVTAVLAYYFFRAMVATFDYHKETAS